MKTPRQGTNQMENPKSENNPYLFPIVLGLFGFAFFLRIVEAPTIPFTRADADLAWQALQISKLNASGTSPIALYTGLTGFIFWISSANNFFARIIPALFGASITLMPYAIIKQKNPKAILVLSLLFALDPILLIYSRQLNGPIMAISSIAWFVIFLYQRKQVGAGLAFGIALLSGKYFWIGIILAGMYLLTLYLSDKQSFREKFDNFERPGSQFFISALLSSGLISSSILLNPAGLTGIASGLVDLFTASSNRSIPLVLPVFILLTYSLYLILPFIKALTQKSTLTWQYRLGFFVALILLSMAFQNRLPDFYAFVVAFLLLECASYITTYKAVRTPITLVSLAAFVFFAVILVFTLLSFNQFARKILAEFNFLIDILPIFLALALILISYILIGLGWGFSQTKPALEAAFMIVFGLFSLGFSFSQSWNNATASQLLFSNSEILYPDSPIINELKVFIENNAINPDTDMYKVEQPISVGDYWEFKAFTDSGYTSSLPAFIINNNISEPGLMAAYRGTSITYARRINFSDDAYAELIHWIATRTLPVSDIKKTLWVATSLFPGGK